MPSSAKEPFSIPVRVYYEDTDAAGIVFYVNYLKFMERARTELLRMLGLQRSIMMREKRVFVVADAQVKYHRPARLDDMLEVTAELESVGRSRLVFTQSIRLAGSDERVCSGRFVVACVNTEGMKPAAMPPEVSGLFSSLV